MAEQTKFDWERFQYRSPEVAEAKKTIPPFENKMLLGVGHTKTIRLKTSDILKKRYRDSPPIDEKRGLPYPIIEKDFFVRRSKRIAAQKKKEEF